MAYRFDAGLVREFSASSLDSIYSTALGTTGVIGASQPATMFKTASPILLSANSGDLALSPSAQFGIKGHTIGDGPMVNIPPIGGDDVPDDDSTTFFLNANEGDTIQKALEHPGDHDFFGVVLTGGTAYELTLTPDDTDPNTGPDLLMNVYDDEGNLVTTLDGGFTGSTENHNFTPAADGTYYIDVGSYLDAFTGGYTLTANINDDPDPNAGTPLDAIDWGGTANRVDTDGVESPNGDDVIHFYFAKTTDGPYESNLAGFVVPQDWQQFEKDAVYSAFEQYDHIINVDYVEVATSAEADFVLISHAFEPNILGSMSPPNEPHEGQAEFNNVGVGWNEAGLEQGAFGYITLIHEFGHGHGLAHPHDTGGGSTVMNGVEEEPPPSALDYTTGDFGLNNGVYTTMSYNDGWDKDGPNGAAPTNDWGYQGTLMAFDVAVLQQKYGANMTYKTGDNTYKLPQVNEAGTFYSCLWDAGGEDRISAKGQLDSVINLNAATLEYEIGGGGWVSWSEGIFGGYTIANGVVIENALGGKGDDAITGNFAANDLNGGKGDDGIEGGDGADVIKGGRGIDSLTGGDGIDTFDFGDQHTNRHKSDTIHDLEDTDVIDVSSVDADINTVGDQDFVLVGSFSDTAGELVVVVDNDLNVTLVMMDNDGDGRSDGTIILEGKHASFDNFDL
jgi:serralysin